MSKQTKIRRILENKLREAARFFPVVAVVGPRQSGKTTLTQLVFPNHRYISLEDFDIRTRAQNDPREFLETYPSEHGIILDEVQNVPELLSYIQTIADREQKKGFFILTGSQNLLLNESISQSLAGRIALLTLLPLSIEELKHADLLPGTIETLILNGGYPRLYIDNLTPEWLFPNYIETYVERDVRQLKEISNLSTFHHFLKLCAGRIGNVLNLTSLGNDCGIDHKTAKAWLSVLEATYIIFLLQPFHKSFDKRLIKAPKLYFYDTGLACSLLNIHSAADVYGHALRGGLVESLCISDFIKQYYNNNRRPQLYFWRDTYGEIDCLIEKTHTTVPIEIKGGKTIVPEMLKQVSRWKNIDTTAEKPYMIYSGDEDQNWREAKLVSWKSIGNLIEEAEKR